MTPSCIHKPARYTASEHTNSLLKWFVWSLNYLPKSLQWEIKCLRIIKCILNPLIQCSSSNLPLRRKEVMSNLSPKITSQETWGKMVCVYSAIKIEWINAICSNMDATRDDHTKWSKSERERQIPHDITSMWNLKYDTNEPIYKSETDSQA